MNFYFFSIEMSTFFIWKEVKIDAFSKLQGIKHLQGLETPSHFSYLKNGILSSFSPLLSFKIQKCIGFDKFKVEKCIP